jgi:NAD(P)-dependent dehydrogenase (short-subunit alcohol dehydrogenase family)
MSGALAGQHAVITGASRGIGAAIAVQFAQEGARLTLIARHWPSSPLTGPHVRAVSADVTDEQAVAGALADAADAFGPVSILVNNAGGAESAPLHRTDAAMVRRMLALNLESVFTLSRLVLPAMLEARSGRIVNIASTAGLKGYAYVTAYVAAKHGVVGFTRALAQEVASSGITVNAVCPGYTDTDLTRAAVGTIMARTGRPHEAAVAELTRSNPQGRMVSPADVAAAVLYLASPMAAAINGVSLSVAGGETG